MDRWHKRGRGPAGRSWRPAAVSLSRPVRVVLGLAFAWLLLCVVMASRRRSGSAAAASDIGAVFRGEVASAAAQRRQAAASSSSSSSNSSGAGVPWLEGSAGVGAAHVVPSRVDVAVSSSGHVSERVASEVGAGLALVADEAAEALSASSSRGALRSLPRTLVAYAYNPREPAHVSNWEFFRRVAVTPVANVWYRVLLPGAASGVAVPAAEDRPGLPANADAAYVETGSACASVWGLLGYALALDADSDSSTSSSNGSFRSLWRAADAVVVVDASVRGPFVPAYLQRAGLHWTAAFSSRLSGGQGDPWMTGSAISCEGAPRDGDAAGPWRRHPYLLPYAWAVDRRGASALARDADVLRCHADAWAERYHGDSGAALAVLSRGGGLDTLLARFQGIDWQDGANWHCNGGVRPDVDLSYDGVSVSPFEAVFVPFDAAKLELRWTHVASAERHSRWLLARLDAESDDPDARKAAAAALASNDWVERAAQVRAERMVAMNARGPGCFDIHYYLQVTEKGEKGKGGGGGGGDSNEKQKEGEREKGMPGRGDGKKNGGRGMNREWMGEATREGVGRTISRLLPKCAPSRFFLKHFPHMSALHFFRIDTRIFSLCAASSPRACPNRAMGLSPGGRCACRMRVACVPRARRLRVFFFFFFFLNMW